MASGDEGGYGEFVRTGYEGWFRYAVALTGGDRDRAYDLVQEALARCLRRAGKERTELSAAYVYAAVLNVFRDGLRRGERSLRRELAAAVPDVVPDVADPVVDRARVMRLLGQVSTRQREVLAARFLLDLSERDAARLLGCSVGSVKTLASRGLARLRVLLGTREGAGVDG
ncbi:RNA polymerase sigma factor (sigma-70 family) [Saccharothrix tamanrassetensis]|uniref:RNA polymerase sigma factor (Sigma-70 family) n=1 Tax=Saccharothrix tamanrassetensis TaxID=1051531 RepID=A0A841CTP0_9PSEU|nr:sigma-70 family RNA polymerase sigma factor [Saccharothrix tamanrassetensis]MBB5959684.1 RNA polymerase sigma factor (sigma-70 family) [Saccharothrix tamanrassetensis]